MVCQKSFHNGFLFFQIKWFGKEDCAVDYYYFKEQQYSEDGKGAKTSRNKKTENIARKNQIISNQIFTGAKGKCLVAHNTEYFSNVTNLIARKKIKIAETCYHFKVQ